MIYSFLITTSIDRQAGVIKDLPWSFVLRGAAPIPAEAQAKQPANPLPEILTDLNADFLYSVEVLYPESFEGLFESLKEHAEGWTEWALAENPHEENLPGDWEEKLSAFEKRILLRAFRYEKLMFAF